MSWDVVRGEGRVGTGNWAAVPSSFLDEVLTVAQTWSKYTRGVDKLWLCWNISDKWSVVQQRMIIAAGWTPVVGYDPNCRPSNITVLDSSIYLDFNEKLQFKAMWPHFPLEFAFLWVQSKLAFWHADLLLREDDFFRFVNLFESLVEGEMSAVYSTGGFRNIFNRKQHRYWELLGCTTREASQSQFDMGCGWWRAFYLHPNFSISDKSINSDMYDSGFGIYYWAKNNSDRIKKIRERSIRYGHFSQIGSKNYHKSTDKSKELELNFDISKIVRQLRLEKYLLG